MRQRPPLTAVENHRHIVQKHGTTGRHAGTPPGPWRGWCHRGPRHRGPTHLTGNLLASTSFVLPHLRKEITNEENPEAEGVNVVVSLLGLPLPSTAAWAAESTETCCLSALEACPGRSPWHADDPLLCASLCIPLSSVCLSLCPTFPLS